MFYVFGGKSIDKNISLNYWFVIDYCFLITQWLMIILFFGPEGHMSYSLTPCLFFHSAESIIKLPWIQFWHLHLGAVLVPWSSLFTEFLCLVSHSLTVSCFWKPCLLSWSRQEAYFVVSTNMFVFYINNHSVFWQICTANLIIILRRESSLLSIVIMCYQFQGSRTLCTKLPILGKDSTDMGE